MFERLQNAYPFSDLAVDSGKVYVDKLEEMDEELGRRAVTSTIEGSLLFPSIAELCEQYRIVREQDSRLRRDAERQAANAEYDNLPRPPLHEIPTVRDLVERWKPRLLLENAAPGECEDRCGKTGPRYRFEKLALCDNCASMRLRVKMQGEAEDDVVFAPEGESA